MCCEPACRLFHTPVSLWTLCGKPNEKITSLSCFLGNLVCLLSLTYLRMVRCEREISCVFTIANSFSSALLSPSGQGEVEQSAHSGFTLFPPIPPPNATRETIANSHAHSKVHSHSHSNTHAIHTHTHLGMHTQTCTCMFIHSYTHSHSHAHSCTHTFIHSDKHTHKHIFLHAYTHMPTHSPTFMHLHTHSHKHTLTHTHSHFHVQIL